MLQKETAVVGCFSQFLHQKKQKRLETTLLTKSEQVQIMYESIRLLQLHH